jgi:NTE family protein
VLASSSIPGLFSPVQLRARGADGERLPYVASRRWVDGSVTDDMPVRRLARIYGCNFFIASQINPFVLWSLADPNSGNPYLRLMTSVRNAYQQLYRNSYPYAMQMVQSVYPWNVMTRLWYGIATQDYTADVNVMPSQRFRDPTMLLSVLSSKEAHDLVLEGEQAAWPKLERIRICTAVGNCMNRILRELAPDEADEAIREIAAA